MSAVLALAWAAVAPPLVNSDESGHFAYIQHLAETGSAPSHDGTSTLSVEEGTLLQTLGLGATINNPGARPHFGSGPWDAYARFQDGVTHDQRANGNGPNQFVQNGPLYYALGAVAYRVTPGGQIVDRIFAVRILGGLLFVLTVICAWLLAAELFAATWPRALAALVVALQPRLGNTGGSVNPDILLTAIWSLFAVVAIRTVRHGLTLRRAVLLGALTGGSVMTHGRGLALVPPLLVVLAVSIPRPRIAWRRFVKPVALSLGVLLACAVLAAVYTRVYAGSVYGGEVAQAQGGNSSTGSLKGLISYVFTFYFGAFQAAGPVLGPPYGWRQGYIETFFGDLGSLDVVFAPHIFDYLQILVAVGLLTLWTQAVWFRDRLLPRWREGLVLAVICLSQIGLLQLSSYRDLVQSNGVGVLWTGRYLLPLIVIFGVTVAYVCSHLPRRVAMVSAGATVGIGIVLQLSSLGLMLDRFYA
jgi:4-amino-4-deoxy-L-arabinose transferase-like glycosyltransferase